MASGRLAQGPLLEVHQQERDGGGCDAGDARRLAEGARPHLGELLAHLVGEARDLAVVEARRQRRLLLAAAPGHLLLLPGDVTRVAGLDLNLLRHLGCDAFTAHRRERRERGVAHSRTAQQLESTRLAGEGTAEKVAALLQGYVRRAQEDGVEAGGL